MIIPLLVALQLWGNPTRRAVGRKPIAKETKEP
jgi:hypothetical protein